MLQAAVHRLTPCAALLGLLLLAGTARAGPVRMSAGCIQVRPPGYSSLPRDGDPFVFLATAATRPEARQLQRVVRERGIYDTWARDFHVDGNPGRPLGPGDGRPFEIIVSPHRDVFFRSTHSDGADLRACDARGRADERHDALIVPDNLSSEPGPLGHVDWSANVLAHELFHAFQGGVMGHFPSDGQWWIEATAEWGGDDIFGFPRGSTREHDLDTSLFAHPELPLDLLARTGPEYEAHHAYAVWRFVQYLSTIMPAVPPRNQLFDYLVATFRAIGHGTPADEAVRTAFPPAVRLISVPGGAVGFTDALGTFWLRHLPPNLGDQLPGGPVALQEDVSVPAGTGGGAEDVSAEWDGTAPSFGIKTLSLNVGPDIGYVWLLPGSTSPSDGFVGINGCLQYGGPISISFYFGIPVPAGQDRITVVLVNTDPAESHVHLKLRADVTAETPHC